MPADMPARQRTPGKLIIPPISKRLLAWQRHHVKVLRESLRDLLAAPLGTTLTVLVLAIALALPAALWLLLDNGRELARHWDSSPQISLYLRDSVSPSQQQALAQQLEQQAGIAQSRTINREQALAEFRALSGYGEALAVLGDNPLPAVIELSLDPLQSPEQMQALHQRLQQLPEVAEAGLDMAWVQRLQAILAMGQRLLLVLGIAFLLAAVLVTGNTLRLSIASRRDEIQIMALTGGTAAFIRRPFLYMGLWYGLAGGVLAWLLVAGLQAWLSGPVDTLNRLYGTQFHLHGLGGDGVFWLLFASALAGQLGAWLAVGRYLRSLAPR